MRIRMLGVPWWPLLLAVTALTAPAAQAKTPGDDRSFIDRPADARDAEGRPVALRLRLESVACQVRSRLVNEGRTPIKLLLNYGTATAPELDSGESPFRFEVDGERLGMPASKQPLVKTLAPGKSHPVVIPAPGWGSGERMRVVYSSVEYVGVAEKLCADCFRGTVDSELVELKKLEKTARCRSR